MTELKRLSGVVGSAVGHQLLLRAGVAMLYAHFEGFVKSAGRAYLEYVCMQRLPNKELAPSIVAILVKNKVGGNVQSRKASAFADVVTFFRDELDARSRVPYKNELDTESNLSSTVFEEIIWCLGCDYSLYATKKKLIDSRLLGRRNHIAHGEELGIDTSDYHEMHDEVIEILNGLRNQIENAAELGSYRVAS